MNAFLRSWLLYRRSGGAYVRMQMIQAPYALAIRGRKAKVEGPRNADAISSYAEVILDDCYGLRTIRETPSVIVDIGANLGMFSVLAKTAFPDAELHAFEPNPKVFQFLNRNARAHGFVAHPKAVSDHNGILTFDNGCDSIFAKESAQGSLAVAAVAADEILPGREIDLLKMDCEGGEWKILAGSSLLRRAKRALMEYHYEPGQRLEDFVKLVESHGHTVVHHEAKPDDHITCGILITERTRQLPLPVLRETAMVA